MYIGTKLPIWTFKLFEFASIFQTSYVVIWQKNRIQSGTFATLKSISASRDYGAKPHSHLSVITIKWYKLLNKCNFTDAQTLENNKNNVTKINSFLIKWSTLFCQNENEIISSLNFLIERKKPWLLMSSGCNGSDFGF